MDNSFSIYESLPEEPELAFLYLDDEFHGELTSLLEKWRGDDAPPDEYYVEYISKVLAAKTELQLDILNDWKRPDVGHFRHDSYLNFRHDVVHYRTSIHIRFGKRTRKFTARLDGKAKSAIHHYASRIRELVLQSELDEKKKETLLDKLAAFENEVDRDRTRLESFGSALVEFAGYFGDAVNAADVHHLLNSIGKVIWGSREEEMKELPRPPERKRLEPPQKQSSPSSADDSDGEIPF